MNFRTIRFLLLCGIILSTLPSAFAIPFTSINDKNARGETCPLRDKPDVKCPTLCVADLSLCPGQSIPSACPSGQQYCEDGKCRASCANVVSACSCTLSPSRKLYPCSLDQTVTIPKFNPKELNAQTATACSSAVGISGAGILQNYQGEDTAWLICPISKSTKRMTYKEPMWIGVWIICGLEALLLSSWYFFKKYMERSYQPIRKTDSLQENSEKKSVGQLDKLDIDMNNNLETDPEDFILTGYSGSWFGSLVFYSTIFMAVGWMVWLAVITADYYGAITGVAFGMFYYDSVLSMNVYIGVWYFGTAWLLTMNLVRDRIKNFFRIKTIAKDAEYIQSEKQLITTVLLDDNNGFLKKIRDVETKVKQRFGFDYHTSTSPIGKTTLGRRYFEFQCTRYVYDDTTDMFKPYHIEVGDRNCDLLRLDGGLTTEESLYRRELIGSNFIQVSVPSFPMAILQEFTSFFYIYQIMILWLYYYLNYYYMGLIDTLVILVSAMIRVMTRLSSEHRIKKMAEHRSDCNVLRDGKWVLISTADIVPGDVFQVEKGITVPCDAVVLDGNVVADESSLTGEPLPVRKFPVKDDPLEYDPLGAGKINTLYAGTTISQAALSGDMKGNRVTALVTRTGTATDKGQLVRKILFPNPIAFIFDEQLRIVMVILLIYGLLCFAGVIWLGGNGNIAAWFYGMYSISQIINPLLPAALVVGQTVAANRLRRKKIFCVDLPRIIIAGKVQIFCFDKTGTLTKEGLEFYGAQPTLDYENTSANHTTPIFDKHSEDFLGIHSLFRTGLATCHSVTSVDDQLIGNPVDIEMFRSTKWELQPEPEHGFVDSIKSQDDPLGTTVHIVKRFEFIHARASMSVAVFDPVTEHCHVFVKGSFEKVKELSTPSSIPTDYDEIANKLAMEGCYVLAMAHSDLGKMDLNSVRNMPREQLESNINFMGLVLFKNKLKPDTKEAIKELKSGDTRTVMITGDTALTGIYIARACEMIPPNNRVLLADIGKNGTVNWVDADTGSQVDVDRVLENKHTVPVELAVTNRAFNLLVDNNEIRKYLLDIRVFARMKPHDKVECVQLHMERGVTAMCGDGGNDCGALRASHVGVALSDAEASIVSPFSSSNRSVMSCVELLRQGRGALATSFAGYKYMIMYGQTMGFVKIFSLYFSVTIPQNVWILVDGFITIGLSWAVTQSKPAKKLASSRPTSRILGPETMASVIGLVVMNWIFGCAAFGWLRSQPWYLCNEFDSSTVDYAKWWLLGDNYEAEILGLVTLFQFVNSAFVFNLGYKFRRGWYRNYVLLILWGAFVVIVSYIELAEPNKFGCMFRINCGSADVLEKLGYSRPNYYIESYNLEQGHNVLPKEFRWRLWGFSMGNVILGIFWQAFFILGPVRKYFEKRYPLERLQLKR